jgi:hypothetical protein
MQVIYYYDRESQDITVDWVCSIQQDKKCLQNFAGKTFWKVVTWKTKKEIGKITLSWILE